jgi:hypothetical protein
MSAQILDAMDGVITVEITGTISPAQLAANQAEVLKQLQAWGSGAILNICEDFTGFADGDWTDLSFQAAADPLIRKMAIIGEKQWEAMALAFAAKGHRPFPIEFFPTGHLREANAWLKA